ncbi:MAG: E3 ubiquitin ligase family protein [Burkholderiales bacterium]|nr:E3 ubiquitin ligase family protein [Burkholderiales bacterium]
MVVRLRRQYAAMIVSGSQLALVLAGLHFGEPAAWVAVLAAVAALSFLAWIGAYRRWRAIADTPTSQVASAAQGYAELAGRAEPREGGPTRAKISGLACCWYRYRIERRNADKKGWRTVEEGESTERFLLRDATGACVVEPDGAEVLPARRNTWTQGDHRYTEWLVYRGDPLYALGEFVTLGGPTSGSQRDRAVGALIGEWKRDRARLLERFDLDRDGELSFAEWELARAQAKREAGRTDAAAGPGTDVMRRPADGRLYLISNLDPEKLARKFRIWAWAHLAIFFGGVAGALLAVSSA